MQEAIPCQQCFLILAPMPLVGERWGEGFIAQHEAPLIR